MEEPEDQPSNADEVVMDLLHDHVPLTLLVDLVHAPPSEEVLAEEGLPEQRWWEHGAVDGAATED